jgi:hypothetical protein
MDLHHIAARLSNVRISGDLPNIDVKKVESAIKVALKEIRGGGTGASIDIDPALREYEYGAGLVLDGKNLRVESMVHHDAETVYEAPISSFDLQKAAEALLGDVQAGMKQFDEMHPEEQS